MFKQLLLVMFFIAQSLMVFAAIPNISGTYTGTITYSKSCSNDKIYSGEETVSNYVITQAIGSGSFSSVWVQTTIENGETKIRNSQSSGTINENGQTSGSFTTYIEKPGILFTSSIAGTGSSNFNVSNNTIIINSEGFGTDYTDGVQIKTCTTNTTIRIKRIAGTEPTIPIIESTAGVQSVTGQSFSITPTTGEILTTSGTISDIGALLTLDNSDTTIQRVDGSTLEINQKAVVTLNPESISVVRGEVTTAVACNCTIPLFPLEPVSADFDRNKQAYSYL